MNKKKESLDISNKMYYDILSRGMKVTRSISRKPQGEGQEEPPAEVDNKSTPVKTSKRK